MDAIIDLTGTGTCAKPGCGNVIVLEESCCIDGCGYVCGECEGPLPEWWFDVEPPF